MIRRYPARCNVLAQGKLAKRRRAYRAPQCRRIPRPCGKLHLSGNGSMAWGMDRPAWKPSEQTTSSARSGKSRTCGGWTISCAAWCVRSSSARPAGFTARFRAAGPNPMPSRSNTNSEATGCCFRSKGTAPARSATTASTRSPCCSPPGMSRRGRTTASPGPPARASPGTSADGWTTGPGRSRQGRKPGGTVRQSPAGTTCSM